MDGLVKTSRDLLPVVVLQRLYSHVGQDHTIGIGQPQS